MIFPTPEAEADHVLKALMFGLRKQWYARLGDYALLRPGRYASVLALTGGWN